MIKGKTDIASQYHQAVGVIIYIKILFIINEMTGIGVSLCQRVFKISWYFGSLKITELRFTSLHFS